jgi:hypothetical protein
MGTKEIERLFGLHVHICTHWLRQRNLPPSPLAFGLIYKGRYWSAKVDDISLWPPDLSSLSPQPTHFNSQQGSPLSRLSETDRGEAEEHKNFLGWNTRKKKEENVKQNTKFYCLFSVCITQRVKCWVRCVGISEDILLRHLSVAHTNPNYRICFHHAISWQIIQLTVKKP